MSALGGKTMAKKSDNPKSDHGELSVVEAMIQLRDAYTTEEKAHRKRVRARICEAYELGLRLKVVKPQWFLFCQNKNWTGISGGPPKAEQRDDAVRFALKFMVGAGEAAQKDASFYYRAIRKFAEEDVQPDELKRLLKVKSLKTLADEHAETKKIAASKPEREHEMKARRPTLGMPKKTVVDAVSELPRSSGKEMRTQADCTLVLGAKEQKMLLGMPVGLPITIKGQITELGPRMILSVTDVKRRKEAASE